MCVRMYVSVHMYAHWHSQFLEFGFLCIFFSLNPSANCSATITLALGSANIAYTIEHWPFFASSFGDSQT